MCGLGGGPGSRPGPPGAQEAQGEHVQPGPWSVTSTNLKSGSTETRLFDAVCVCNGHYAKPIIPRLPGLDGFKGELLHSHTYRERAPFASKRVVCLGGGQSGRDISQELCTVSSRVVLSHRVPRRVGEDPLIEKPPITAIHEDGTPPARPLRRDKKSQVIYHR